MSYILEFIPTKGTTREKVRDKICIHFVWQCRHSSPSRFPYEYYCATVGQNYSAINVISEQKKSDFSSRGKPIVTKMMNQIILLQKQF